MTQKILGNTTLSVLTRQADQQGLTPLHLAASFNSLRTTIPLLMADRHVAYMKDTEGRTALHIAAYTGHKTIMEKILSICPDCYELVDKRGWNALHFAVNSFYPRGAVRLILQNSTLKSLWNEKDANGNTVLHHHSNSSRFVLQLGNDPRLDQMAFNKQNLDAFDVVATNEEIGVGKFLALRKLTFGNLCLSKRVFRRMVKVEGKETIMKKDDIIEEKFIIKVEKAAEAHLVVAALIATVTFAAGIAVPGGFVDGKDTDAGAAILRTNVAFKAFIISNSIAMVLSTISALIQLFVPMWFHQYFTFSGGTLFFVAFSLTVFAMGAMMLAFFMAPYSRICDNIDATTRRFWWKPKNPNGKFLAWKAWEDLCIPKGKGGLEFKTTRAPTRLF
uniref:PGG domain-containing protein n=1 Tax=Quercus lobata TaxID=97700 RepID=A0A7N2LKR2_QUELO